MSNFVLLFILVALTNSLTIRTQTKIALNNTKSPQSTQQISSQPQKQQEFPNGEKSNADKKNNVDNIIVTTITRVYPEDGEEYYEYEQILPLKDIKNNGNITLITQGNEAGGSARNNTAIVFPNSNEKQKQKQKGNVSIIPEFNQQDMNKNSSNLNQSKSEPKQKGKDTMNILPIPIISNTNNTQKNNDQQEKSKSQRQNQKAKEQVLPKQNEGQSKQVKQEEQRSTKINEGSTNLLPFGVANNTNKQKQNDKQTKGQAKQNDSKIMPIVVPFQTSTKNETENHNSTKQAQKTIKDQNGSFIPAIIPFNQNTNQNQNKQHPKNNQTTIQTDKTTQKIINAPQKNYTAHGNTTQVQIPQGQPKKDNQNQGKKNSFSNTPIPFPAPFAVPFVNNTENVTNVTQDKQKDQQKQFKGDNHPIILPIATNSTQNASKGYKQQNTNKSEGNHSNPIIKPFSKQQNQTKVTPIIPIILPSRNQHNQTDSIHPNSDQSPIQHNNTHPITNNSVITVPPTTSPGQVPPKASPQKTLPVSQSVTMVSFSCEKATDQLKKDTCNNQTGCNILWDEYKKNCEKSGGNMLVMFGPSSTSINSKEELFDLIQKK